MDISNIVSIIQEVIQGLTIVQSISQFFINKYKPDFVVKQIVSILQKIVKNHDQVNQISNNMGCQLIDLGFKLIQQEQEDQTEFQNSTEMKVFIPCIETVLKQQFMDVIIDQEQKLVLTENVDMLKLYNEQKQYQIQKMQEIDTDVNIQEKQKEYMKEFIVDKFSK